MVEMFVAVFEVIRTRNCDPVYVFTDNGEIHVVTGVDLQDDD